MRESDGVGRRRHVRRRAVSLRRAAPQGIGNSVDAIFASNGLTFDEFRVGGNCNDAGTIASDHFLLTTLGAIR